MEELLAILGFSAGASLAIGTVRTLRRGLRATAVEVTRAGLRAGDAVRRFGEATRKVGDEARAEVRDAREEPERRRRAPASGRDHVRTIEIATQ
jgi:hypothetical protein